MSPVFLALIKIVVLVIVSHSRAPDEFAKLDDAFDGFDKKPHLIPNSKDRKHTYLFSMLPKQTQFFDRQYLELYNTNTDKSTDINANTDTNAKTHFNTNSDVSTSIEIKRYKINSNITTNTNNGAKT